MNNKISEDELKEIIQKILVEINIEDAMPCAPIHALKDILARRKADDLQQLARMIGVKYIMKYRKAELAVKIAEELAKAEILDIFLFGLDFSRWMFFLDVAEKYEHVVDALPLDYYDLSQNFGLMQLFYHEEKLIVVVPDEVKVALKKLDEDDYIAFKSFSEDIVRYASAAVNLYGVLPVALLADLLAEKYEALTLSDVLVTLKNAELRNEVFCIFEKSIVHRFFEKEDGQIHEDSVRSLLDNRLGRPRYSPSTEDFLQYEDHNFFEAIDEIEMLEEVLMPFVADATVREDLIDDIAFACRIDAPVRDIFSILEKYGVEFGDKRSADAMIKAIIELKNHSRSWILFGHTPEELRRTSKPEKADGRSKIVPLFEHQAARSLKAGRNDPCPCGSGKKYKNCCGK